MNAFPLLTAIIALPLAGAVATLAAGRQPEGARRLCLVFAVAELLMVLAVPLLCGPAAAPGLPWLVEDFPWIEALGARYSLALDGLSYLLVLLTAFLGVLAILVSWKEIHERVAAFHALLMASLSAAMGIFLARDLLLFYIFWELQVAPMFFLIWGWGHEERRMAAYKFVIFSIAGSLPMLLGVIWLALQHSGLPAPLLLDSLQMLARGPEGLEPQGWLLAAFLLAFVVKTPMVPVHVWLPDAHTQAPTAGSLVLAGVLLKTGTYAILRWALPLFPAAAPLAATVLAVAGVAGLFYASWIALAQTDLKRLVAYSSVGHMGLVLLGLAAGGTLALSGAVLQMISHALTTGALFAMVGMLAERSGTRKLAAFGGLWKTMPMYSAFFLLFAMASAGLPGLSNFVGELLIMLGSFQTRPVAACLAFAGVVVGLVYVLRMVQATLFGPPQDHPAYPDLDAREIVILGVLAVAVLALGLHPDPALQLLRDPLGMLTASR